MGNWGAVSVDVTQAKSTLIDDTVHTGQSWRILYAKSLNTSGTNFQLTGYRYSTAGFYTFTDTTYKHMNGYDSDPDDNYDDPDNDRPHWFDYYNLYYTKRGKLQVNISQQLGKLGSLYVTGSQQTYWHTDGKMMLLQLGYNTSWHDINMGVSFNYSASSIQPKPDQAIAFNVSLPLGKWLSPTGSNASNNAFTTLNMNQDNQGSVTRNAGVSGTLLEGNNLSYSVQQGHANQGAGSNGSASLSHQGGYGNSNVAYNYSENGNSQQVNYGVAGGVIAHRHGVTFSQPLGETNVLVEAPGANRVKVENATGIKTDWRGYAVVPFATTYRKNRIALDTTSLGDKVEVDDAVVDVVPTKGALVRASFITHVGNRALLTLMHNNVPVPFGASVTTQEGGEGSIVADGGQVYLSGLAPEGTLNVQWGDEPDQKCSLDYDFPETSDTTGIIQRKIECK
ncbi:putative outer membrane usher protein ElfC precursor [compost metagenome]